MGVKVTVDRVAAVMRSIRSLTDKRVMVGIPADKAERKPDPDEKEPINNAAIGYIQENGAPEVNIPARPFLVPGVRNAKDPISARLKKAATDALDGNPEAVDRDLNAAGLIAQNSVRAKINEGVPPPLKPSTLASRRSRGRTGTKPLIDTGQLRNSITYVIRRRSK